MTALPGTDPGPIGRVYDGMAVMDAAHESVGTVDQVKMGDPGAATEQGQTNQKPSLFARDLYAAADQIGHVDSGTVHLSVVKHELVTAR
ncbi:DUF2171 domain-containing protein [Tenggerimyces flavus]|uniref:DUF2171 domain-containing protein n=1 Tax=Tenggerimyces flavus TaxID=1708749 RepID=A0ABV7YPC5_9ACTN|nr:DUF2171 domain-containing protein [Tenggerimyces flavus]MBM7786516.1 hypothetical protein [Tenggerimyces flavus]